MRVAIKVILATTLGMLAVLIGFGYFRTKQRVALIESDMRRDHRVFGSALGLCMSRSWPSEKADRAVELVQLADAERPHLRIAWAQKEGPARGKAPLLSPQSAAQASDFSHSKIQDPDSPERELLVTRLPVEDGGALLGEIEIAESFATPGTDVRHAVENTAGATLIMIGVAALNSVVFGIWLVGKPLNLLIRKARRVGDGDLSTPLLLKQRDEIGELAREMNAMCERLQAANDTAEAEHRGRIRAIEQLRHGDRLMTIGRLAAGVAHELGTPLNVIAGRTKMLRTQQVPPETTAEYLSVISNQAERMTAIIRQLLDFARRREPKRVEVDLKLCVEGVARLTAPMAKKSGVEIAVSSSESIAAFVDVGQIEQVLSNLIINGIQASNAGGTVRVSLGVENGPAVADVAVVRVEDDGHGMDEDTRSRIFEPFFTTKDIGHGTGLGLSVAHGIVLEHGGSITVESQPGAGSLFTVRLPVRA